MVVDCSLEFRNCFQGSFSANKICKYVFTESVTNKLPKSYNNINRFIKKGFSSKARLWNNETQQQNHIWVKSVLLVLVEAEIVVTAYILKRIRA